MKIILTYDQMKKLLSKESIKLPLIFKLDKISKKEVQEILDLLKKRKKD